MLNTPSIEYCTEPHP